MNSIVNLTDMILLTVRQGLSFGRINHPVLLLCSGIGIIFFFMYAFRCQNASAVPDEDPETTPIEGNTPDSSEEYIAESVPDLLDTLHACLMRQGVDISRTSLVFLLSDYARHELLQVKKSADTDEETFQHTKKLLSRFFRKDSGKSIIVFQENKEQSSVNSVELSAVPCGPFSENENCFISLTGFRSLIRDTEDEYYLSESVWRKIDILQQQCSQKWYTEIRNKDIRSAEKVSSVLIAAGQSEQNAFQYIWQTLFLPTILGTGESVDSEELNRIYEDCLKICKE